MKHEKLELIIPKKSTGKRIDIALQELMSDYSRAKLQAWIKSGFILLDSKKISSKDIVLGGEIVSVEVQQDEKILQFGLFVPLLYFLYKYPIISLNINPISNNAERISLNNAADK